MVRKFFPGRWVAIAALLALSGCAGYSTGPDGYATGYYDGPVYDGLDGYNGFGLADWDSYPHFYHDGHEWHPYRDGYGANAGHDDFAHTHVAWHGGSHGGFGAPHGGFAHVSMAGHGGFGHGGFGHGGGGHGRG